MATRIICDCCGIEKGFFTTFTHIRVENRNPEFEDVRIDICSTCKRRLDKYFENIKKEKKHD